MSIVKQDQNRIGNDQNYKPLSPMSNKRSGEIRDLTFLGDGKGNGQ